MNLTVVITVYGLKFHVLNFPFSNFNGKPKTIDTNGDDRKERPLNAVAEELECVAVELDAVTADYGVFRIPFDETNFSSCKTEQYEESTYCDKSELQHFHPGFHPGQAGSSGRPHRCGRCGVCDLRHQAQGHHPGGLPAAAQGREDRKAASSLIRNRRGDPRSPGHLGADQITIAVRQFCENGNQFCRIGRASKARPYIPFCMEAL